MRGLVDALPAEKACEHPPPSQAIEGLRHVRVLAAYVGLVATVAFFRGGKDGEVDVTDQAPIATLGRVVVAGARDERGGPLGHVGSDTGGEGRGADEVGAALFVVVPPRIVDDVVEPERRLDLVGPLGQRARGLERLRALEDVLFGVVMATGAAVDVSR